MMGRSLLRVFGVVGIAVLALAVGITGCKVEEKKAGDSTSKGTAARKSTAKQTVSEKAKVEFYVMSMCPFGVKVEDAIAPVLAKIGGDVDFSTQLINSALDIAALASTFDDRRVVFVDDHLLGTAEITESD